MAPLNDNPFDAPDFLEGLEAAGYLQRLDVSEARITARYQHALTKMKFASHSEEFLTRAGVRKVHGSTVQFFNEDPVSDPFVHVMVGSLPPQRQAPVTPLDLPTSFWTPICSPDEAPGTVHFTVSHPGFWPLTVVFDMNPQDLPGESRFRSAETDSETDSDDGFGRARPRRSASSAPGREFRDPSGNRRSSYASNGGIGAGAGAYSDYGRSGSGAGGYDRSGSGTAGYGRSGSGAGASATYNSRQRRSSAYGDDAGAYGSNANTTRRSSIYDDGYGDAAVSGRGYGGSNSGAGTARGGSRYEREAYGGGYSGSRANSLAGRARAGSFADY